MTMGWKDIIVIALPIIILILTFSWWVKMGFDFQGGIIFAVIFISICFFWWVCSRMKGGRV
jgi:hypothetical protein